MISHCLKFLSQKAKTGFSFRYFLCLLFFLILASPCALALDISREDKIKASYVFNFIRFIQWPDEAMDDGKQSIQVCSMSRNKKFSQAFEPVVGKKVNSRLINFKRINTIDAASSCNVLFVSKTVKLDYHSFLKKLSKKPLLTISDKSEFCKQGGLICMINKKGKIKLEINLEEAKKSKFKISSNLLEVATIVQTQ